MIFNVMLALERIVAVLANYHFRYTNEKSLQEAIVGALDQAGIANQREVRINPGDVVDIFVPLDNGSGLVIEIKVGGSLSDVTRQIHRYLASEIVAGVVLASTRSRLANIPPVMRGKPVRMVMVGRSLP